MAKNTFKSYLGLGDSSKNNDARAAKTKSTFTSYIELEPSSLKSGDDIKKGLDVADGETIAEAILEPHLLDGEVIVSSAHSVLKFSAYTDFKQGTSGALFCTNFKISFVTADKSTLQQSESGQRNLLLGDNDIPLCAVQNIYQISGGRRKRINPNNGINGPIKKLEIHCKDFRIHTFSFKFSPKDQSKSVCNAILHHAFPNRVELLFAFEYKGPTISTLDVKVPGYCSVKDWERELERQGAKGWRVAQANSGYQICDNLPECFVVPANLVNAEIMAAAPQFVNNRPPVWSYSHSNGASLVRMPYLCQDTTQLMYEDIMLKGIELAHPRKRAPYVVDLQKTCPSVSDIQNSFDKLKDLCMPVNLQEVQSSDMSWFSTLDSTRWLYLVSVCLTTACGVAEKIVDKNLTVVIRESDCRDLACVMSSLVQLLLDPYTRSIEGFQRLIQREWVIAGHRFRTRSGHISTSETEQCPIFLFFLDCVWQLQTQFPASFAFTETYLTSLWDGVHIGLFSTFTFDSIREQTIKCRDFSGQYRKTQMLPVWDWAVQYLPEDMSLFNNPLYIIEEEISNRKKKAESATNGAPPYKVKNVPEAVKRLYARKLQQVYKANTGRSTGEDRLRPQTVAPLIKFWSQCYLRWLSPVEIYGGGTPSEYMQQCILVEEVLCLMHKVAMLQSPSPSTSGSLRRSGDLLFSMSIAAKTPKLFSDRLTSSFPFSPRCPPTRVSFFGTPISLYVEKSGLDEVRNSLDFSDSGTFYDRSTEVADVAM